MTNKLTLDHTPLLMLAESLRRAGIDTALWGQGEAKSVADLGREIQDKECRLSVGKGGECIREVIVTGADVYYTSPEGKLFWLREKKQVFPDGTKRKRDFGQSVTEKAFIGEEPKKALQRGVQEELGLDIGEDSIGESDPQYKEETHQSRSYPGLQTHYKIHAFKIFLAPQQYNPDGYVESGDGKTTHFVWDEVNNGG